MAPVRASESKGAVPTRRSYRSARTRRCSLPMRSPKSSSMAFEISEREAVTM